MDVLILVGFGWKVAVSIPFMIRPFFFCDFLSMSQHIGMCSLWLEGLLGPSGFDPN